MNKNTIKSDNWKCATCRWYYCKEGEVRADKDISECRVDPPQIIRWVGNSTKYSDNEIISVWPKVNKNDFCGKWQETLRKEEI